MKKIITICFIVLSSFFLNVINSKAIDGIDVSAWQGDIDFNEIKNSGIEIVYIRSSAGNSYIDEQFENNYDKAKSAGLNIGFYHYVTARTVAEAREQARFFASTIAGKVANCRLAMDFEVFTGLSREEVNEIAESFLETLSELTNKELVIYSDEYNANNVFNNSLFDTYPLWVAEYDVESPGVDSWIGWQYTDVGRAPGIDGDVDCDIFEEDIYLSDTTAIKEPDINPVDKSKIIYYRVQSGNTLSQIALHYNVPLSLIISLNNIKNPNLIFPNEVLKINTNYKHNVSNNGTSDIYTVKSGNTLSAIAHYYHVLISNLVTWNNIKNPNLIYPGEQIIIKPRNNDHLISYTVKPGNTLSLIAEEYKTSIYELSQINNIKNPNLINIGQIIYIPETYILEDD